MLTITGRPHITCGAIAYGKAKERDKWGNRLHRAEEVLSELYKVQKDPIPWEVKRRVIELLVWEIRVNTITKGSKREAEATITFASDKNTLSVNCTGKI